MKGLLLLLAFLVVATDGSLTAYESHQKQQFCSQTCALAGMRRRQPGKRQDVKALVAERRRCRIECVKKEQPVVVVAAKLPPPAGVVLKGGRKLVRKRFH